MDGFDVMPLKQAAKIGDIFVTLTGDVSVLRREHFSVMKDKALVANAGHFDVEIDIDALSKLASRKRRVKHLVDEYRLKNGRRIYLLGEGRLVNLACAEGHPAEVMDLSFANQALSCEYIANNYRKLSKKVYRVPEQIDNHVSKLKLKAMGVKIDKLTRRQKQYLASWQEGT
jgi:adenosylhomocysteinase